jgi:hypothetical protein
MNFVLWELVAQVAVRGNPGALSGVVLLIPVLENMRFGEFGLVAFHELKIPSY